MRVGGLVGRCRGRCVRFVRVRGLPRCGVSFFRVGIRRDSTTKFTSTTRTCCGAGASRRVLEVYGDSRVPECVIFRRFARVLSARVCTGRSS